jgi:hypothetical protein
MHTFILYFITSMSRIPKSDPMEGRLQDMLRYNMEKHAGQPIDTLATSRRYSSNFRTVKSLRRPHT